MALILNQHFKLKPFLLNLFLAFYSVACVANTETNDFFIFEDEHRNLTVNDVIASWDKQQFNRIPGIGFNPGFTTSAFWVAVPLPAGVEKEYLLRIGNAHINQIDLYEVVNDNVTLVNKTGDHLPFNSRPLDTRLFVFPLKKTAENASRLYLARIDKHHESLQLSVDLLEKEAFYYTRAQEQLLSGIFFGIIVLVILFCIFLFLSVQDRLYLYFVLFVSSMFFWIAADKGFGYQYFWPDFPQFASRARPIFSCASSIAVLLFLCTFLGLNKSNRFYKRATWLIIIGIGQIILFLLPIKYIQFPNLSMVVLAIHMICCFLVIAFTIHLAIKESFARNKNAWFFLLAFISLLSFSMAELLIHSGSNTVFENYLSQFGMSTGMVIATIILTFGLAYRFNSYRKDREQLLMAINNEQLANAAKLREVQERVRRKISEQLHDDVGAMLSVVALQLSSVSEQEDQTNVIVKEKLEIAGYALQQVSSTVRNLSHILMPLNLAKSGFIAAIKDLCTSIATSGKIQVEQIIIGFENTEKYDSMALLDMFRIIQELLNNILKHSEAKNVLLELVEHEDAVTIIIEDNGKGIGEQGQIKKGLGLTNLSAKVTYFHGEIEILNKADGGTLVTIELPVDKLI